MHQRTVEHRAVRLALPKSTPRRRPAWEAMLRAGTKEYEVVSPQRGCQM